MEQKDRNEKEDEQLERSGNTVARSRLGKRKDVSWEVKLHPLIES
jgi:hypothetical protein